MKSDSNFNSLAFLFDVFISIVHDRVVVLDSYVEFHLFGLENTTAVCIHKVALLLKFIVIFMSMK